MKKLYLSLIVLTYICPLYSSSASRALSTATRVIPKGAKTLKVPLNLPQQRYLNTSSYGQKTKYASFAKGMSAQYKALLGAGALAGGAYSFYKQHYQPEKLIVFAQEQLTPNEQLDYDILKKISSERDITTIREQLQQFIGSNHNQRREKVISLAKRALENGFKEDVLYLASIYQSNKYDNKIKDPKEYVSPYSVISNLEDIYGKLNSDLKYDQRKKEAQKTIQDAASKGNLYAQFLQIHIDYLKGLGSSDLSWLFANEEINRAGGFFVASRLNSLLKKDPNNKELRYALGLNLFVSGYTGHRGKDIYQGLKLMHESGLLKVEVGLIDHHACSLSNFKKWAKSERREKGIYLKEARAFIDSDGVVRVPSIAWWNDLEKEFNKSEPIDEKRLGLLDEYASQLSEFGKTLKEHNIKTERKSDNSIRIYIDEGNGSRKGLGQGGFNKDSLSTREKYMVYDYAKNNPSLNAVTRFLLHAIHHSEDARSVEMLIKELKAKAKESATPIDNEHWMYFD